MGAVMLPLLLFLSLTTAICADRVDSGQYFSKISSENDVIADNAAFLNEEFFKCQKSQSCVVNRRGVKNMEKWEKVSTEPVCKFLISLFACLRNDSSKELNIEARYYIM